jgi:hypothetical protein
MDALLTNLQSPIIMFFVLGIFAGLVKSDLEIPKIMAKGLALYLIAAIGLKGGIAIANEPLGSNFVLLMFTGVLFGFLLPFLGYALLRKISSLSPIDAAAINAHYGSVSLVTFIAAGEFLKLQTGNGAPGHFIAVLAVMESPAILAGLLLAAPHLGEAGIKRRKRDIAREVFLNGTMILLLGAMAIGAFMSENELVSIQSVFIDPFEGVLCFFLLDMGINIGRRGGDIIKMEAGTWAFSFLLPLFAAAITLPICTMIGLTQAEAFMFVVLNASASYIAVPAALKIALPEANPALYLTLPLGLTFPFNVAIGIPLYYGAVQWFYALGG